MRRIMLSLGVIATLAVTTPVAAKYERSRSDSIECYDEDRTGLETADLVWKMDGKNIIKIAVTNRCSEDVAIDWHKPGKYFGLIIPANTTIDLWKKELEPFGNAVKKTTGEVQLIYGIGDERWFSKVWQVRSDGKIILVHTDPCPGNHETPASCR